MYFVKLKYGFFMKIKQLFCILLIFIGLLSTGFSETLGNVPIDFCGTYLPEDYIKFLEKYKSHEKALNEISKTHYDALILSGQKCLSTKKYTDGYEIKGSDFNNWKFLDEKSEKIIMDENNFRYIRISEVQNYNGYKVIANYIAHKLLFFFESKDLSVENGFLKVKDNLYQIILEPTYSDDKPSLFLYTAENHKRYFLKIKDNRLQIFLAARNPEFHMQFDSTDEIVYDKTMK